ncbi:hypothetical protein EMA8858_03429 [Emticicia aquatica]|uniref:Uncharacterized protein n=1 Tax=Emticicia aquatica TaxID=1681835 RepID=A0ABN8EW69_9BACT|nr:hypothetical protein [Emticicia aquatica]CAH0997298.1 hypothetical protein EMA8858_03429 [Emticicia aquatica]
MLTIKVNIENEMFFLSTCIVITEAGQFQKLSTKLPMIVFDDKSALKAKTSYLYKISTKIDSQTHKSCKNPITELKNY